MKIVEYNARQEKQVSQFIVTCKSEKWKQAIREELEIINKIDTCKAFVAFDHHGKVNGFISIWKTGNVYFISWMNSCNDDEAILKDLLMKAVQLARDNGIKVINTTVEQTYMETLQVLLRLGFRVTGYTRHRYELNENELQLSYLL
jgi:hypothetical protein